MEINIPVKSKSNPDEPYEVTFLFTGGKISVLCNCPAGEWGKLCKHKTGLIENDLKLLFNPDDAELLEKAHGLIANTSLLDVHQDFATRKKQIESQQAKLKKELSNIKNGFGRQLHEGVE